MKLHEKGVHFLEKSLDLVYILNQIHQGKTEVIDLDSDEVELNQKVTSKEKLSAVV